MELIDSVSIILGLLCTSLGIGLLFVSWKSRIHLKETFTVTGWILVLNAGFYWVVFAGWEYGLIYALTAPSFVALALVVCNGEFRGSVAKMARRKNLTLPSLKHVSRFALLFFLAVPFALVASVLTSNGLGSLLPTTELNQLVFAAICMPFVWGLFAYWSLADTRTLRPVLSLIGLSLICIIPYVQA